MEMEVKGKIELAIPRKAIVKLGVLLILQIVSTHDIRSAVRRICLRCHCRNNGQVRLPITVRFALCCDWHSYKGISDLVVIQQSQP